MTDIIERIRAGGVITPALREEILITYGHRGKRALEAVDERQVKKYADFTVVTSSSKEYVVEDDLCTCGDFLFRGRECWHILAARLAVAAGLLTEEAGWYQDRWREGGMMPG